MSKKATKKTAKKMAKKAAKKTAKKSKKPSLLSRIAQAKRANEIARRKYVKQGEKFFKEAVKSLFKEFPKLKSFSWNEYTPHWNDGDECSFGVYFEGLNVNEEDNVESVWDLQSLHELLSSKDKEKSRIEKNLAELKKQNKGEDEWEVRELKSKLKDIEERDPDEVAEKYKTKKTIIDLLDGIEEDVYREMFGEGTVIVRRDGITVEECEHD
jgi:hypothetical protein